MTTISDAIIKDHREIEQYYNEVVNSGDQDYQQRYGNQFTWELARHSVGEELVIYPAFEKAGVISPPKICYFAHVFYWTRGEQAQRAGPG
jgi:hypothetical protein